MTAHFTDSCPVCGMSVESVQYSTQYHKMYFHFCSEQCRERFEATPQLYSSKRVEQREPLIRQRQLRLAKPCTVDGVNAIVTQLLMLMGVTEISVKDNRLQIRYDLMQVTQSRIEQSLSELGVMLDNSWWQRFQRGRVHIAEENELDNLASTDGSNYNRPPSGA